MKEVLLPILPTAQSESWTGLLDLADRIPDGWALIGGQMVHLHCWERNTTPNRPTDDLDAVLDIRTMPTMLENITQVLVEIGFSSEGKSPEGHEHRWVRGNAVIDLLIADGLGERANSRKGIFGGTTIPTPGGQGALDRAEKVNIIHQGCNAVINRPNLMGAIVVKAAAYGNTRDSYRERHLMDIAVLSTLVKSSDAHDLTISKSERQRLALALKALKKNIGLINSVSGASEGVSRVELLLER
ncbi:MAG: hypothetical protein ACYC06_01195 [Ilumatobacteraceae bacterium]